MEIMLNEQRKLEIATGEYDWGKEDGSSKPVGVISNLNLRQRKRHQTVNIKQQPQSLSGNDGNGSKGQSQ